MSDGPLLLKEHGTGLAQLHRGCRHQLQCFKLQLDMTGQTQSILWDILLLMRYTGKRIRKNALKAKKIKAKIWSLSNRQFYTCVGFSLSLISRQFCVITKKALLLQCSFIQSASKFTDKTPI